MLRNLCIMTFHTANYAGILFPHPHHFRQVQDIYFVVSETRSSTSYEYCLLVGNFGEGKVGAGRRPWSC